MSETLERTLDHAEPVRRPGRPEPVTLVVSRHVNPAKIPEYEAWLREIAGLMSRHVGYIGLTILRPKQGSADPEYVMIAHFDTDENLSTWMVDPERVRLLGRTDEFGGRPAEVICEPGIDFWFTPDNMPALHGATARPPARWKMASVLTVLIFLLSQALMFTLSPVIGLGVPRPVVQFLALAIQIAVLSYWMLPKLTRVLAFWLNPKVEPLS